MSVALQGLPGVFTADVSAAAGVRQFALGDSYTAAESSRNRKTVAGNIRSEDKVLDRSGRVRVAANAMDLHRNAVLFAWAVRRHLDYVTLFDFQPMTGDTGLDRELRELMERDSAPEVCDIGGRHSWNRFRRLAQVRKVLDGDCGLMALRSGALQGVESHMIRNPTGSGIVADLAKWEQGVRLGRGRRAVAYSIQERDIRGELREREVPASQLWLLGAFEGRFDQIRGISPVAGALADFRDVYETQDLMRAKVKLEQIFGVAFIREKSAGSLADEFGTDGQETEADTTADETAGPPPNYDLSQNIKGFDLNTGEDVKLIQSSNPHSNAQEFLQLSIAIAIKALDLPMNFFDESRTNFFGSKAAWIQYERACVPAREDQLELHRRYTQFRVARWLLPRDFGGTGELVLPASMDVSGVRWKWVPRGMPWWDPQADLTTDLMAVACGLKTFQQVCDERGLGIWTQNLEALTAEFTKAREAGFSLAFQSAKLPVSLSFGSAERGGAGGVA